MAGEDCYDPRDLAELPQLRRGAQKYLDGKCAQYRENPPDEAESARHMREGLIEHLEDYATGKVAALSKEAAFDLAVALRNLHAGFPPPLLTPKAKSRGNASHSFDTAALVDDAVRYGLYVRAGYLNDRTPNKTVADAFQVSIKTVEKWMRETRVEAPGMRDCERPLSWAQRRELVAMRQIMKASGLRYCRAPDARSTAAIRARDPRSLPK